MHARVAKQSGSVALKALSGITNKVQGNDAWTPTLASQIHPLKSLNRDWSQALTV